MSRVSPLHVVAATIWFGFCLAMMAYLWFFGRVVGVDIAFGAVFAVVEGWAVRNRSMVTWQGSLVPARDTMSQTMTWFARMSKPGTRWYQSWNAVVVLIAVHLAYLVARQAEGNPLLFWPTLLLMSGFLVWHWLRPDTKG